MNDLMDDSNFYHNKVCSSLSEDDYDDDDPTGHVVMSKSQKKSMKLKEMFANDQGFNRRKAYDSLNRAVDKSIDILNDPGLKGSYLQDLFHFICSTFLVIILELNLFLDIVS